MVKTEKCSECRLAKQKCLPKERVWEPSKQKCYNCLKGNRPCGPSESPPVKPPRRRGPRVQENSFTSSVEPSADSDMAGENIAGGSGPLRVTGAHLLDNSKELRDQLKDLDAEAEVAHQIQAIIEPMEHRQLGYNIHQRTEYQKLIELRHVISQNLLSRLNVVEALGDRAHAAGEMDLAENAYIKVLEIYRQQPPAVASLSRPLLLKMASFYWGTDQPLRAEKYWWEIFKLRESTGKPHCTEELVWQRLALSLSKTSGIISDTFRSHHPDLFLWINLETPSLILETPFPPVHTMIQREHSSNVCYNENGHETFLNGTVLPNVDNTTTGLARNLPEIIQKIPDTDLTTRDLLCRTPLFLAAFRRQEDIGYALITRIAKFPLVIKKQEMNARDISGQTILGIAILSRCSLNFIRAIIEHGAVIDPEPLPDPPTPLQAACMTSNVDVVKILLEGGADINHAFPTSPRPADLAKFIQNDKIIQLIAGHTILSHSSITALSNHQESLDDNNITSTVEHTSLPRIDATRINIFQEDDQILFPAIHLRTSFLPDHGAGRVSR